MTGLDLATLPRWNLNKHFGFAGPFDDKIDAALAEAERSAKDFCNDFKGKLGEHLEDALRKYEEIDVAMDKVR